MASRLFTANHCHVSVDVNDTGGGVMAGGRYALKIDTVHWPST